MRAISASVKSEGFLDLFTDILGRVDSLTLSVIHEWCIISEKGVKTKNNEPFHEKKKHLDYA